MRRNLPKALFAVLLLLLALSFRPFILLATPPENVRLIVSGDVVDKGLLKSFALEALMENFSLSSDRLSIPSDLKPDEACFIEVPKTSIRMIAKNIRLSPLEDTRLLISNDPEIINGEGVLLKELLKADESVRLMYYHKGTENKALSISTVIVNPNSYPADFFVLKALGGPSYDGIFAGHMATMRFFEQERFNAGRVVTVLPRSFFVLAKQELRDREVSTGIFKVRQLSGGSSTLLIESNTRGQSPGAGTLMLSTKEDGRLAGVIDTAYVDIKRTYSFESSPLNIRIGESPTFIPKKGGFDLHLGNYCLMHRIEIAISNNSNKGKQASVFYVATGGPARGIFLTGDSIIETGLLDPKNSKSEKLLSVFVPAKSSKLITLRMMPQPGSFYPTRLTVLEEKP